MYSGSDSAESPGFSQWALNPANYQNMSNEQVDWAALAQQWIIMKETGPPIIPPAEKRPKIDQKPENLTEGGEAPMEVENDKDEHSSSWDSPKLNANSSDWPFNPQNPSWGWNSTWSSGGNLPPVKPSLLANPTNYTHFIPPEGNSDNATFGGYNTAPNTDYNTGYWTSAGTSKQIKPHNRRFSKVNVNIQQRPALPTPPVISTEPPPPQPALDAARRKQLPAWIREGLEKMEKDKLKQIEREKEKQEREEYEEKMKLNEKETMEILKSTIKEQQRSKFESDKESSEEEEKEKKPVQPRPAAITAEEQMMNVRRTMTEILLKVTNAEIETICREELQRYLKKIKASDQRTSAPSGANVTAQLGLGIYGDSASSSEEESEVEAENNHRDSDAELKDSIKRRKAEFTKIEKEIEDKLAEAEENRKNKEAPPTRSPSPETNDNDTQVDAKNQGTRKHNQRPSKAPTKQSHHNRSSSTSSSSSSYASRKHRRSSTSSSGGKHKRRSSSPKRRRNSSASRKSRRSRSHSRSRRRRSGSKSRTRRSNSRVRRSISRSAVHKSSRNRRSRSRNKRRSRSPYSRNKRRSRSRSSSSGRGSRKSKRR